MNLKTAFKKSFAGTGNKEISEAEIDTYGIPVGVGVTPCKMPVVKIKEPLLKERMLTCSPALHSNCKAPAVDVCPVLLKVDTILICVFATLYSKRQPINKILFML